MNVSATTITSGNAKLGHSDIVQVGSLVRGEITSVNVTGNTTINGNANVKSIASSQVFNQIRTVQETIRTGITSNIGDQTNVEGRHIINTQNITSISGEILKILNVGLVTNEKLDDVCGRVNKNEVDIVGLSNEVFALENATDGLYPLDQDLIDLSSRYGENLPKTDILFIRVYGLKDDLLDGDFATRSDADEIDAQISLNTSNISDVNDTYLFLLNNTSTLATRGNYDDISGRTTDVSNAIDNLGDTDLSAIDDRNDKLTDDINYLIEISNNLPDDIEFQKPRIPDISLNISANADGVMIGISANVTVSGVQIGEEFVKNGTYFNSKITDIRGVTTISDTQASFIRHTLDTDFVDEPRDVSQLTVDFRSTTPYAPTHHILLDPSEAFMIPDDPNFLFANPLKAQADAGTGLDIRISRLSKSRRIVVTVPPATASRVTISLYDDDTFTDTSGGYNMSTPGRVLMEDQMLTFNFLLTGQNLPSESGSYKMKQNIHISPGCVPAIDISFLDLNLFQKEKLVEQMQSDYGAIPRLQYFYNPTHITPDTFHGGSVFHLVRDISETEFKAFSGISNGDYVKLRNLSSLNSGEAITNTNNVTLNGIPSFLMTQTIDQASNGNRVDFIFGGASKFVHDTLVTDLNGNTLENTAIASPFDYYGGNSYTFEIHLVSTGKPEHRDLAKVYITEKTRQAPLRRFYNSKFIGDASGIDNVFGGGDLVSRFTLYREFRRNVYTQLNANPPVVLFP